MSGMAAFGLEGGWALALVRGLSVATLLSVFGALLFRAALAPQVLRHMEPAAAAVFGRQWRALFWSAWLAAVLTALGWLVLQSVAMVDAPSVWGSLAAMPAVLMDTQFGHFLLLRLGLLVLAAFVLAWSGRLWAASGLAACATALQAGHGHAAAMADGVSPLLLSVVAHLLAAGAWLGGLLPLLLLVAAASPEAAARASHRFAPLGLACVLLLAGTAFFQASVLIGGLPGLAGTAYGWMALVKLLIFAILVGLAVSNRFRLTPALAAADAADAKRRLRRSIATEAGAGLLLVLTAGFLGSLPPAMHVQPVWPFPHRLSLTAVQEDAEFRLEVVQAGLALVGATALLVLAALARRVRWPAVAVAGLICWLAVPHLGLLLADAYPTSFYRSPTGFTAAAIAEGARLYPQHCAGCHGVQGQGDGPDAKGLAVPPADLTAAHLWMHSDGELFWWLSHGIDAPAGGQAMPGFAAALPDDALWDLIDAVRAHNAGVAVARTGEWSPPIPAPELQAVCRDREVTLHDLRGQFVRLVIGPDAPVEAGVVTILASPAAAAETGACIAGDERVVQAYAVISGLPEQGLRGAQFLIDDQGWLRALHGPDWKGADGFAAELGALRAHPAAAQSPATMNMRM